MRSTFSPNLIFERKVLKIVKLASNSRQNWKTVRFPLKNCTKRSFQVMRSTFWPNRIFERESFQNRHAGLEFSPKRENSAPSMQIVQNALFRSCAALFGQIKVLKIVKLASNFLQSGKTVRFARKLYKTRVSGHAQHVLAKSYFSAPKFSKSWNWPQILFKAEKQCAFHENCTTHYFQVMRSRFWPNRILERQSSQSHYEGLKFSRKRENSAPSMKIVQDALFRSCAFLQNRKTVRFPRKLYKTRFSGHAQHVLAKSHFWASKFSKSSAWPEILVKTGKQCTFPMKIVQNAPFRSCAARFGQIAFLIVKVLKIVTRALNSFENEKTVRLPWKFYTTLFSGHAHFFKTEKQCAFQENCTKPAFQVMRSTFWPNRIFERQSSQNRHLGLKFSSKRENSALSPWKLYNAPFRSCAALFGQIKVLKIVKLASNFLQSGKTVRFARKLYKTRVSGHAQHVLAKSYFSAPKFSKSWNWPQILFKAKRSFQVMRSTFWPNRIFDRQSSQNRHAGQSLRGPEILSKTRKQCAFHENCTRRSFQVMRISSKQKNSALSKKIVQNPLFRSCAARFGQIAFLSVKVLKIVSLAWNSRQNGKTVHFPHENCTKRSFQVLRSTFWPNRIFDRQSSQNRHAGLKFFRKRENSAPSMKILHDALFRSCAFL